jgi:hypothetical protein
MNSIDGYDFTLTDNKLLRRQQHQQAVANVTLAPIVSVNDVRFNGELHPDLLLDFLCGQISTKPEI